MRRRLISIAILTLSSSLAAQPMPVGAHVRVEHSKGAIQGSLVRVSSDAVVVRRGQLETVIPRAEMNAMFRRTSAAKKGAAIVGIPSALLAGAFVSSMESAYCVGPDCSGRALAGFGGGAIVGGLAGAALGAIVGGAMGKWERVYGR
jgi:hypothetical protein